jgi:hypothetical protein
MKIAQLISGMSIAVTNEEQQFINTHNDRVKITSLDEHEQWLAQNMVRKGLYSISNDNVTLLKNLNETDTK